MSLLSSVKVFLPFNQNAELLNEVTNLFFTVEGTVKEATFLSNNLGYVMIQEQYLTKEKVLLDISTDMILGFWLAPHNPGVFINSSNNIEPIKISLMDFEVSGPLNVSNIPINSSSSLALYEITREDGKNALMIDFDNGLYSLKTEYYSTNIWHHFLLIYNGNNFYVIIDGKNSVLENFDTSAILPPLLDFSSVTFNINKKVILGSNAGQDIANNQGSIDDIFVLRSSFETTLESEKFVQKILNNSTTFALDSENETKESSYNGFFTDEDPTTINITSMSKSTNRFFAGRSDGSILEGCTLLWESRRDFTNSNEVDFLNKNVLGDKVVSESGFLKIENSIIKL